MKNYRNNFAWFTLVELLVVITILVILGTIAFINLGNFAGSARDGARIENLANLEKGLNLYQIKAGTYPMPESAVTITASGVTIGYQGFARDQVGGIAKLSKGGTIDPSDANMYPTYSVNATQTKMQLMGFLEDGSSVTALTPPNLPLSGEEYVYLPLIRGIKGIIGADTAFASTSSDYSKRTPTLRGDTLGILLGNGTGNLNQPVQETSMSGIDLTKTTTNSGYALVFSKNDSTATVAMSGTGAYTGSLFTFAYNKREDLLANKAFASNDPSLVGYWDMETLSGGLLKDFSWYWNHGTCYNSGTPVTCGGGSGPQFVDGNGKSGKAMSFDGVDDYIKILTMTDDLQFKKQNTVLIKWSTKTTTWIQNFIAKHVPLYITFSNNKFQVWTMINSTDSWQWLTSVFWIDVNKYYFLVSRWNSYTKILDQFIDQNYLSKTYNFSWAFSSEYTGYLFIWADYITYNRNFLNWTIDEVRIYNRALSDSEIQTLYNATK